MVQTKAQRSAAAVKEARTRKRNAKLKTKDAAKKGSKRKRIVATKKRDTTAAKSAVFQNVALQREKLL
ncbi:MAG: hypothetical protein OEM28_01290 [Nitrosopumilus sp.]|nr:hypothetical protein [Nitrosopumilus sp.]MDH3486501.1 hypothetical protein [Nitrosopumilus sp.]